MRPDEFAIKTFAKTGLKLFWLRQAMFVGSTIVTSAYLGSYLPVFMYFFCLSAEIAETVLGNRIVSRKILDQEKLDQFTKQETKIAIWSATGVGIYAIVVAWYGTTEFFFVPLTYLFSAALYASMFNHQIKSVLVARLSIYSIALFLVAILGAANNYSDQPLLSFAQFVTIASATLFIGTNAAVARSNYVKLFVQESELTENETKLRREIETRQYAETEKQSSEIRFSSLFENAPIPIREEDLSGIKRLVDELGIKDEKAFISYIDEHPEFLRDCAKTIIVLDANKAAIREHGYKDKSEMLRRVVKKLSPVAYEVVRNSAIAIYRSETELSYETKITRLDGMVRTVEAKWTVLPGYEGSYARILLCSVDLTDRLAAEEALRQAQKMEAVGQLTGGVAHDFNNLLAVIQGNMELLCIEAEMNQELSMPIFAAVERGAELTQRLLAFSRKQPLSVKSFDLGVLVEEMGGILKRTLGDKVSVRIDVEDDLWPVEADVAQVETALLNFALNSRDAMETGGILTVSCRNKSIPSNSGLDLKPGDFVEINVTDTGAGMDAKTIKRAFEPFFTTKEVGKGSGLGLSMAYGFAKQSGGTLRLLSSIGEGTSVKFYLPRSLKPAQEGSYKEITKEPAVKTRKSTILLLEDDNDVRRYLKKLFELHGYKVLEAETAANAEDIVNAGIKIDLLVSDVLLKGGRRGPEFALELKEKGSKIPVVFISGQPDEFERSATDDFKEAGILAKPFSKQDILRKIELAIETKN